jgi:hypothetical protein|eukprot:COSAG02_NODE_2751_length_8098_cov_4.799600_8_plen_96_part_00
MQCCSKLLFSLACVGVHAGLVSAQLFCIMQQIVVQFLTFATYSEFATQTPHLSTGGCVPPPTMQGTLGMGNFQRSFCRSLSDGKCTVSAFLHEHH